TTYHYIFSLFFFFSSRRRHTRSLRDWSSDVCSSDLAETEFAHSQPYPDYIANSVSAHGEGRGENVGGIWEIRPGADTWMAKSIRSEERRVGKECRSQWWADH